MTAKELFFKTMCFNWLRLGLGMVTILISLILLALCLGLGWLFGSEGMGVMFLVWLGGTGAIRLALMHYCGYMIKAGHVAILARAVNEGAVPANQVQEARQMVTERFLNANVYFAVDKLVDGAVRELQRYVEKAGNFLNAVPGVEWLVKGVNFFLSIALGYIDECCLGYTFIRKEQNAFKSAADGVVIYYKNWKVLLKDAAWTALTVIGLTLGVTLVVFVVFGGLFKVFGWSHYIAFFLALFVALAVKFAFIDSWILVKMMTTYMQAVPQTTIPFDLYGKLSNYSNKFRELYQRGIQEMNPTPQPAAAGAGGEQTSPSDPASGA